MEAYLSIIFPPALTLERSGEIIALKQKEEESLYNAWERYKQMLRRCPMYGIEKMTQMDIFYHSMNYTSKGTMDAAFGGAFKRKNVKEATQLIEELAKRNYRAPFEALGSNSWLKGGVIDLKKMSAIEAELDALVNRMKTQDKRGYSCNELELVEGVGQKCATEEGLAHEGPY